MAAPGCHSPRQGVLAEARGAEGRESPMGARAEPRSEVWGSKPPETEAFCLNRFKMLSAHETNFNNSTPHTAVPTF